MMCLFPPGLWANSEQMKGKKVPTYVTGHQELWESFVLNRITSKKLNEAQTSVL